MTTKMLPADVQEKFEVVGSLQGGPVFALPHYGFSQIDFSQITLDQAALLVRRKFPNLRAKTPAPLVKGKTA